MSIANSFKATDQYMFDIYAPLKEKHVGCHQAAFVNKNPRNTIMKKSTLVTKFRQERTISSHVAYKKQQNICAKLLRKTYIFFQ